MSDDQLAELEKIARARERTVKEVLAEVISRHVKDLQWQSLRSYGRAKAQERGIRPGVQSLIAESRKEHGLYNVLRVTADSNIYITALYYRGVHAVSRAIKLPPTTTTLFCLLRRIKYFPHVIGMTDSISIIANLAFGEEPA